jgi:PAS domain S-box-containing protein
MSDPSSSPDRRRSWRWRDWPLRRKGLAVVILPLLALLGSAVLTLQARRTHEELDRAELHASQLRTVASETLIAVLDIETGARGYLLTGDRFARDEFEAAAERLRQGRFVERLKRLLEADPIERRSASRIELLLAEQVSIAEFAVELGPENVSPGILARGRLIMDALREEIDGILSEEGEDVLSLRKRSERQDRFLLAIQVGGLAFGLLGGLVAALLFASGIVGRVNRLERNSGLLAEGEPLAELPGGNDEIGSLGRAMEGAAARLRETRGLLQGVVDGTPDVVYVKDLQGRYLLMNRAGRSYLNRRSEDIVGKTDEELYDPELAARIRETDRAVIESEDILVYESTDRGGKPVWHFLTTKGPFRDGTGRVAGLFGISRDITDRKRMEDELEARADELARSNKELEHFAYVASHDLQEPLRIVAGYAQLLGKRYGDRLDQDAEEFIGFMVDGVRRMQELINGLLQYSRVGTKGEEMARIDLDVAVNDAVANLEVAIEENGAQVTRDDLPEVVADRRQLAQLFQNLIGNAIKFHGDRAPAAHVGAERRNGEWVVEVRDNGIGIDPDHRDRIFDIFERLHGRERYEGTGIGLAICKKIVERHGGRIWVESQARRGAAFRFTIPSRRQDR